MIANRRTWPALGYLVVTVLLGFLPVLLIVFFSLSERTFPVWDFALYHDRAVQLLASLENGWSSFLAVLGDSLKEDYTSLFAVPVVPLMKVLGTDRTGFLLSLYCCYTLPAWLVLAAWCSHLTEPRSHGRFLGFFLLFLLIPSFWEPLLRGTPDHAGWLAVLLIFILHSLDGEFRHWRTWVFLPLAATMAILLRRQYFLDVVLYFLSACGVYGIWLLRSIGKRQSLRPTLWILLRFGMLGLLSVTWLNVLAPTFLGRAWWLFSSNAYGSWNSGRMAVWQAYSDSIGGVILLLGLGGCGLLVWRWKMWQRHPVILTAMVVIYGYWQFRETSFSPQHALHLHFLLFLSLAALVQGLLAHAFCRRWLLPPLGLLLLLNFLQAFPFLSHLPRWPAYCGSSRPIEPMVRSDYDEIVRLVRDLGDQPQIPVSCVFGGVSHDFNHQALSAAWRMVLGKEVPPPHHWQPFIDSRDNLAVAPLFSADLVLLAHPYQGSPTSTKIVRHYFDTLVQAVQDRTLYEPLPGTYQFANDVQVTLHRRIGRYETTAILQLADRIYRDILPEFPAQSRWCPLTVHSKSASIAESHSRFIWYADFAPREKPWPASVLYYGTVNAGQRLTVETMNYQILAEQLTLQVDQASVTITASQPDLFKKVFTIEWQQTSTNPLLIFSAETAPPDVARVDLVVHLVWTEGPTPSSSAARP